MKIRKAAVAIAVAGSALTVGATAAPAFADTTGPALTASWHNTGQTFYWYSSCAAAGQAGVNSGWQSYDCKGSSAPWASYELWGLY
ncbi:hypothetical protein [Actinomadura monticuli]|uniref:Lactococcin 972 family bacteriocin n=1 Tax=Actinomadura monticuli TaxID=3097367 RepID=A0ABV4Q5K0_9ACTN